MEVYNNIVCVTVDELTCGGEDGAVMGYECYKKLASRSRLRVVRPGKGLGSHALVEWSSLPARYKERYVMRYGDPEQELRLQERRLVLDQAAAEFFAGYRLPDGGELKSGIQREYVVNASVLNRLQERIDAQRRARRMCGNSTPMCWEGILAESERLRGEYGHTLPASVSRLRDRIRLYSREGYACLVSGKLVNGNAVKITEEGARFLIAMKRSRVPVYTNMQIFEKYNEAAPERGWKPLRSAQTVTRFLQRPEVRSRWLAAAAGELEYKKEFIRQNVTVMPSRRDSVWYGDGTKLNLFYKQYTPGGYKAATVQVFEVIDAYSECLLGYHISSVENFPGMYEAYRMAIESTGRLPVELVYDNQGGTKRADAREWLSGIARCARPAAPHNAASKSIESVFGRFQRQVLHKHFNYTGGNVTDRDESSKPNMEFIEANLSRLPTYEEMCAQYAEMRREWNAMPHFKYGRPRAELYAESVNDEAPVLTDAMRRELFWITSQRECRFTARGLSITIEKRTYTYDVYGGDGMPDMAFRRDNTGRSFWVRYDPHDMSRVRLCTKDRYGYRCVAEASEYRVVHRAMQDQDGDERSFIRRMDELNKLERVRSQIEGLELEMEHGVAPEQHGLATPRVLGLTEGEYERLADIVRRERAAERSPEPDGTVPSTVGQHEKELSNLTFDQLRAYDRM